MSKKPCQLVMVLLLMAAGSFPAFGASSPAVSGVVRDARGEPQMGALVQLLSVNSSIVAQTYTNLHGSYVFDHVFPGTYEMKATAASFLPTLRENLHINRSGKTVVNLTLNTLFEAIQWLPAEPRSPGEPSDDWKWTLRASSNRPLLRFLEDGPLVVVTGADSQSAPELEARVSLTGLSHEFGEGAPAGAFEIERSSVSGGHLILRADLAPDDSQRAQYLAGFEQPLGPGREIRSVVAFRSTPEIQGASGTENFQSVLFRSAESVQMGPNLSAEVGNQVQSVQGPVRLIANSPFGALAWHSGDVRFSYSAATAPEVQSADEIADLQTLTPQFSEVDGVLRTEHGFHQELRLEKDAEAYRVLVALYRDQIENPVIAGGGYPQQQDLASGDLLYDPLAQVTRMAGPAYSTPGFAVEVDRRFGRKTWASVTYAQGKALVFPVSESPTTVSAALETLNARGSQAVTGSLNGELVRSGTRWQASYRWQPGATLTPVDLYDNFAQTAYFSFLVRQRLHCGGLFPNGTEALISVRNLLEQGYRPLLTSDGNTLYFAQADRSIQGGLSFNF